MDSNSQSQSPNSSKKPRKMRQVIDEATWKAVEGAICVGGLGYSEAGRKFGIEPHAIMGKAKRNNWPLPSKIAERAAVLQSRYNRNGNEEVIEAAATSWAEKGEMHRALAFNLANGALAAAARTGGLPIESWRDAHLADQVARKSCGLDHENTAVNINMALVTARLEAVSLSLPKDALPGMPGSESQ
jgi:hypothetical protein